MYFLQTAQFLGMGSRAPLIDMLIRGSAYCSLTWAEAQTAHPDIPEHFLANYCFNSMFFVELLHNGYGLELERTPMRWKDAIEENGLDWPLGATLRATCGSR